MWDVEDFQTEKLYPFPFGRAQSFQPLHRIPNIPIVDKLRAKDKKYITKMKWSASSFLENRIFDKHLVKDHLVDKWNVYGNVYNRSTDYRQFLETHPWSTINGTPSTGANATQEYTLPPQTIAYSKIPYHEPWPTYTPLTTETAPTINHQFLDPCFAGTYLQTKPLTFPNLVNSFEKNPEHTARVALYTRHTPAEWRNSCITSYTESDINRNQSERLRNDAVRLMREADERTTRGQRDAGRRLGERLTDLTFLRNELHTEFEKLVSESALLTDTKLKATKALQDLEAPLHIGQECMYNREGRQGIEKVHDQVEKTLLTEVENLRMCQQRLKNCLDKIHGQLSDCRAAQHALEEDIFYKESTLGIDSICFKLNNNSRGINYFGGIEKFDPTISSIDSWTHASNDRIIRSQTERAKSVQLRSDTETLINSVATLVWDCWSNTNNSLNTRSSEMCEAKNNVQYHIHKIQQEIFDIEKYIELLRKSINDKSNPLKVAQTRLEARGHRTGMEQCKDFAHVRLIQEVCDIQDSVTTLHRKLQDAERQHQHLLKTKTTLEESLKRKVNALFIDREKCMGIRRTFPVSSLIKY